MYSYIGKASQSRKHVRWRHHNSCRTVTLRKENAREHAESAEPTLCPQLQAPEKGKWSANSKSYKHEQINRGRRGTASGDDRLQESAVMRPKITQSNSVSECQDNYDRSDLLNYKEAVRWSRGQGMRESYGGGRNRRRWRVRRLQRSFVPEMPRKRRHGELMIEIGMGNWE